MTRLLVHVEGQTEETFVNSILAPHLRDHGYSTVAARLIGNSRRRDRRGGIKPWTEVRLDILRHLRQDQDSMSTTMVDYYGLPGMGRGAWPGRAGVPPESDKKAVLIEQGMLEDIGEEMGNSFDNNRFIPYVMMHEFEAMLFSDCEAFCRGIGRQGLAPFFQDVRNSFGTPEEIDDSPDGAPSKRIERKFEQYQKPLYGNLAALEIGLPRIRDECPHFSGWLDRLENLPHEQ